MDTMSLQFLPLRAQNDCHREYGLDRTAKLRDRQRKEEATAEAIALVLESSL